MDGAVIIVLLLLLLKSVFILIFKAEFVNL